MSRYETRQELAEKIDWEGGLEEFAFGYGVNLEDLPDDEIRELFAKLLEVAPVLDQINRLLYV